jgi:hypothetical protein
MLTAREISILSGVNIANILGNNVIVGDSDTITAFALVRNNDFS